MKSTPIKFALTVAGMVLSVLLLRWTHWDGWFICLLLAFLMSTLYGLDLGHELRDATNPSPLRRLAGLAFGVPQALLGLTCIGMGSASVVWVLYNAFIERQQAYSGGFLSLGIGPAMVWIGYLWVRHAFHTSPTNSSLGECLAVEFDDQRIRMLVLARLEPGWNADVAWDDITRVCFISEGPNAADVLLLSVNGREQPVPVLMEAKGAPELLGALTERGLFPEHVWRMALGDRGGGHYCWPPH